MGKNWVEKPGFIAYATAESSKWPADEIEYHTNVSSLVDNINSLEAFVSCSKNYI